MFSLLVYSHPDRPSEAQRDPEYIYGKKMELGVQSAFDVLGLAKTVLLACKQKVP